MKPDIAKVVEDLLASNVTVVHPSVHIEDGSRVEITVEDVTAFGTIASRALHWSTMKGVNTVPVILDGTGQRVEIHARHIKETK